MKPVKRTKPKTIRCVRYNWNKDPENHFNLENGLCFIHHGEMKDQTKQKVKTYSEPSKNDL